MAISLCCKQSLNKKIAGLLTFHLKIITQVILDRIFIWQGKERHFSKIFFEFFFVLVRAYKYNLKFLFIFVDFFVCVTKRGCESLAWWTLKKYM
jgi:hypothetical protein